MSFDVNAAYKRFISFEQPAKPCSRGESQCSLSELVLQSEPTDPISVERLKTELEWAKYSMDFAKRGQRVADAVVASQLRSK